LKLEPHEILSQYLATKVRSFPADKLAADRDDRAGMRRSERSIRIVASPPQLSLPLSAAYRAAAGRQDRDFFLVAS
jgi:hypothetical protein